MDDKSSPNPLWLDLVPRYQWTGKDLQLTLVDIRRQLERMIRGFHYTKNGVNLSPGSRSKCR